MTKRDLSKLNSLYAYLYHKACRLDMEYQTIMDKTRLRHLGEMDYYELIIKQTEIRAFSEVTANIKQFIEPMLDDYRKRDV